jgi:hypothetical protein
MQEIFFAELYPTLEDDMGKGQSKTKSSILSGTKSKVIAGLIVTIVMTIVGAIWFTGGLIARYDGKIEDYGKQLEGHSGRLNGMSSRLDAMSSRVDTIYNLFINDRLKRAAANPKDKSNIEQAKETLLTARKDNVRINLDILKSTGSKFVAAAETQPSAWQTVQQYLDYRSFLNTSLAPAPTPDDLKPIEFKNKGAFVFKYLSPNGSIILHAKRGPVTPENSARLEELDEPNPISQGTQLIVLEGNDAAILLDWKYMKNVIIRNLTVVYHGGPLILDKVYFVNCTFNLESNPKSQDLTKAILANTATFFSAKNI